MPSATRRAVGVRLACAVLISVNVQPGNSWAAEWFADPAVSFGAERYSNITYTSQPHEGVTVLSVTPSVLLGTQTEAAGTDINASLTALRYPGNDLLDKENYNVGANTRYDGDQRGGRFGYSAEVSFVEESLLDNDLLLNSDIGLAQTAVTRRTNSLSGRFRWLLTPYALAELRSSWSENKYSDDPSQEFFDYRYSSYAFVFTWIPAERLRLYVSLSYADLFYPDTIPAVLPDPFFRQSEPDNHTESLTTSGQLGAVYQVTPTMDINASAGARKTRTSSVLYLQDANTIFFDNELVELEGSGTVYNLTYGWRPSDRARLDITAGQDITPSGQSAGLIARSFQADYAYSLTERLTFGLTLDRSRVRSDTGTQNLVSAQDRDFSRGETRLDYRLSETWQLGGRYSRASQQFVNSPDVARNDTIALTLYWRPIRRYFSR